jgi:hypothetical protein
VGVLVFLLFSLFVLVAVARSSHLAAPEASIPVTLHPDWGNRWETDVKKGVDYIPPAVTPPYKVLEGFARDVESPAIAKEVIGRLGLRMTPDELLGNLTVEPDAQSSGIRVSYRDPARETPQRARKIVRTVAVVAGERVRRERPPTTTSGRFE